jgi:type IV secretion system protein VirB11
MTANAAPMLEYRLRPIAHLLDDPKTNDVVINGPGPGQVFVWQMGAWHPFPDVSFDIDDIEETIILAGAMLNQDVGPEDPLLSTRLPVLSGALRQGGERFQGVLAPAVSPGSAAIAIRKHEATVAPLDDMGDRYRIADWAFQAGRRRRRNLDEPTAVYDTKDLRAFFRACVRKRLNILLVGPTGAGKTSMAKTLLAEIPREERLITIEDVEELALPNHQNVVRLLYSQGGQSTAKVGQEELLQATKRMRPHRIILQELRDVAALTYVQASLDHRGSVTTVHGTDVTSGYRQVFALAKTSAAGHSIDTDTLSTLLAAAVDVIVAFREEAAEFWIDELWFIGEAIRRGKDASELLR